MNDHSGVYMLCAGLVFYTAVLFLAAWLFPEDKEFRAYFAGVLSGFSGSLFTWLQKKN